MTPCQIHGLSTVLFAKSKQFQVDPIFGYLWSFEEMVIDGVNQRVEGHFEGDKVAIVRGLYDGCYLFGTRTRPKGALLGEDAFRGYLMLLAFDSGARSLNMEHHGTQKVSQHLSLILDPEAKTMVVEARKKGTWVLLQNCHLYKMLSMIWLLFVAFFHSFVSLKFIEGLKLNVFQAEMKDAPLGPRTFMPELEKMCEELEESQPQASDS